MQSVSMFWLQRMEENTWSILIRHLVAEGRSTRYCQKNRRMFNINRDLNDLSLNANRVQDRYLCGEKVLSHLAHNMWIHER